MAKTSRIFNIMQYERHPDTGALITMCDADGKVLCDKEGKPLDFGLNIDKVESALRFKSWRRWAYILHDKDKYTKDDEEMNPDHKEGELKPPHWHIVVESNASLEVQQVAKWFGIPMQFIDVPKGGRRAFLDCVEYLTHGHPNAQKQGKILYADDEVEANFDFRKALDERAANMIGDKEQKQRDLLRLKVQYGELTPRQMLRDVELSIAYHSDRIGLEAARKIYVNEFAPMPPLRLGFYITGKSGDGKTALIRSLARSLYPNIERDDDLFFVVGADNVSFEGYDAQPIVIWDDFRADELLDACGGRGNLFKLFDPFPSGGAGGRQNVKHGSVRLVNAYNIVNSVQPYEDFLQALVSSYTNKQGRQVRSEEAEQAQANRRFPIIIPVDGDEYSIMLNKGIMEGTREYEHYYTWRTMCGSFANIKKRLDERSDVYKSTEIRMVSHFLEAKEEVQKAMTAPKEVSAEFLEELQDYGKPMATVKMERTLKKLWGAVGDDPDAFIEAHGIMNISSPELRSVLLSIIRKAVVSPDGDVIPTDEIVSADVFLQNATDEELEQIAKEAAQGDKVDWKAAVKAMRAQMVEGVICPDDVKTDKEAVAYVLPRLRIQLKKASDANAPRIREAIERLEACRFNEDGLEVPF